MLIRATFHPEFPFCITTPSGEPIMAFRLYKHAVLLLRIIEAL